ncbi:MAG: response regulator [Chitinivibrionales bacterium]|nr:response regulator [Chitinivibrionales bacterium]
MNCIIAHKPQVAFLDITMPGISVFNSLQSLQKPPLIVFQTAYSEHAARAFEIDALDYLLKPVRYERLEKTVAKIQAKLTSDATDESDPSDSLVKPVEQVTIKIGGKTKVIPTHDIVRISFEDGFCYLYTNSEKLISDKYLNYYEEKLRGGRFYRTSRTDIINLDHITVIHRLFQGMYTIELKNGMQIDLSRRKAQLLKKIIDF